MVYCTNQDVIDLTGTSLSTAIIDRLIEGADRKVNRYLTENGIATNPSPVPDDIKDASIFFSAAAVLNRHMVDGTLPAQYSAENLSEKYDVNTVIKGYQADAIQAIRMYIDSQTTDDDDYSLVRVVGQQGERVGDHEVMTEAEEDET